MDSLQGEGLHQAGTVERFSMSLKVDVQDTADEVIVSLNGEMDTHSARMVTDRLNEVVGTRAPSIVVDATGLQFLDSSGISELLRLRQRAVDGGGEFRVRAASTSVRRVLEITGLVELLGVD
ncbi:MAG: STAS domain-containing protein [Acidimicrobiales bacterium]